MPVGWALQLQGSCEGDFWSKFIQHIPNYSLAWSCETVEWLELCSQYICAVIEPLPLQSKFMVAHVFILICSMICISTPAWLLPLMHYLGPFWKRRVSIFGLSLHLHIWVWVPAGLQSYCNVSEVFHDLFKCFMTGSRIRSSCKHMDTQ